MLFRSESHDDHDPLAAEPDEVVDGTFNLDVGSLAWDDDVESDGDTAVDDGAPDEEDLR